MQLEAGDAGQRARRRADLGREVRQRRDVVAEDGRVGGEPVAGQLHAVAGVAREADDDAVESLHLGHGLTSSFLAYLPRAGREESDLGLGVRGMGPRSSRPASGPRP